MQKQEVRELFGFPSKNAAIEAAKQLEWLRNNLAHAQDIATHDWAAIARIALRIEEAVLHRKSSTGAGPTTVPLQQGKRR